MKHWDYELGEIQLVFNSGKTYRELGWGPYQFTQLRRTTAGDIYYSWELGNDKIEDYVELDDHRSAVSADGEHWTLPAPADAIPIYEQARLSDGRYFAGFELEENGIDVTDWIDREDKKFRSCSYTSLLPLSDTSFLMSYSDFHYPTEDGRQTKALLVRKVTLIPKK
ncbi:MAG: hypothetical protein J6Q82_07345 [Clostridia bacterium]|nr:hypothetical protein [Clostridia bacterium]